MSDERRVFGVAGSNGHACEPNGWRRPDPPSFLPLAADPSFLLHHHLLHPLPMLAIGQLSNHKPFIKGVPNDSLNINYDSHNDSLDGNMNIDSDSDAVGDPDVDADGDFLDDDATTTAQVFPIPGPSTHQQRDSVRFPISSIFTPPDLGLAFRERRIRLVSVIIYASFHAHRCQCPFLRVMRMKTTTRKRMHLMLTKSTERRRFRKRKSCLRRRLRDPKVCPSPHPNLTHAFTYTLL